MCLRTRCTLLIAVAIAGAVIASAMDLSGRVRRDDPIRCKIFGGFFCRWTCRSFGHSDGTCENDECMCNEQKLEKYVCGGDVGNGTAHTLCAGWCQFKGRQSGDCDLSLKECVCTPQELESGNIKCISDDVCSIYCQLKEKKASGTCTGTNRWDCVCVSNATKNELQ